MVKTMTTQPTHDTTTLTTPRLTLRRYIPEDAPILYQDFGLDPEMSRYSGWNPYATPEMAQETVKDIIGSYADGRSYSWAIEHEGKLIGTVGAYDYDPEANSAELGISIARDCWGQGFAGEALTAVVWYLTENEGIGRLSAWCAADNIGSARAMEKAGMKWVRTEEGGLEVGDRVYDKVIYEYRTDSGTGSCNG